MTKCSFTKTRAGRVTGFGACALAALFFATGCEGDAGERGALGPEGPPGAPGTLGGDLTTFEKALSGVGGLVALQAMTGFQIESSGGRSITGEGVGPTDTAFELSTFDATIDFDITNDNLRLEYIRNFILGPVQRLSYTEIIKGDLGFIQGSDSIFEQTGTSEEMLSARLASTRRQQRLLNPHILLQEMQADSSIFKEAGVRLHDGSIHELLEVTDSVFPLTLWVNANTGQISKLSTIENDFLFRDIELEIHYVGWKVEDDDVLFPRDVFIARGGEIIHREERASVVVNPALDVAHFDLPTTANPIFVPSEAEFGAKSSQFFQMFAGLGIPIDEVQESVDDLEVHLAQHDNADICGSGTGVWHLTGGSHHSLAIAYDGGVVIVEAPLYPERSEAILEWIQDNDDITNKTVTHVISTHHHQDHSAGLRTFVNEGATIVLQENSERFFSDVIFKAPSTISPDSLHNNAAPPALSIVAVEDDGVFELFDGENNLVVAAHHIFTTHSNDYLMVHVPSVEAVFNSDLWGPIPSLALDPKGSAFDPQNIVQFHEAIVDKILAPPSPAGGPTVSCLVGGHSGIGPFSHLVDAVTSGGS